MRVLPLLFSLFLPIHLLFAFTSERQGDQILVLSDSEVHVFTKDFRYVKTLPAEQKVSQQFDNIAFRQTPTVFAANDRQHQMYIAFDDLTLAAFSTTNWNQLGKTEKLDAPAKQILHDPVNDLLFVRHPKHVSIYRASDLRFKDYLPLEAHPSRLQLAQGNSKLIVQMSDEPDSVAVYNVRPLYLDRWVNVRNRTFNGRKIDVSSAIMGEATGEVHFFDAATKQFITKADTNFTETSNESTSIPPGVTPSSDIHVNNTIDSGPQVLPAAEFDGSGNFVITWTDDNGNDGNGEGVFAREYNANLTPTNTEYQANDITADDQGTTSAGVGSNGDFVLIWRDSTDPNGDFGVYARQFTKGGTSKGPSFIVPNTIAGRQMAPSIAGVPDGTFIAAWSGPDDGDGRGTWTRRHSNLGAPLENEFRANTSINGNTWAVDVTANNNGAYVVVWRDDSNDRIRGRAFHANGTPVASSDFQAGPLSQSAKNFEPNVGVKDDGTFIVVWRESSAGGIVAQKFNSDQTPNGTPYVITTKSSGVQYAPSIAMAPDGKYVVVWRDSGYGNDEVAARLFDAAGQPLGNDFIVPENPAGDEFECSSAMDDAGNFLVVYKDRDGQTSIAARYFSVAPPPVPITVTGVNPQTANRNSTLTVTINGSQFTAGATANFNDPGIIVNNTSFIDSSTLSVNITIGATAFLGLHDISVNAGTGSATGQDLFAVKVGGAYPAPTVAITNPISGNQSQTLNVDITGVNFANDAGLASAFGAGITVNSTAFIDGATVRANISISSAATPGVRNVNVTNPGGATGTCIACFTVIFNPTIYSDDFGDGSATDWIPNKGTWSAATNALVGQSSSKATSVSPFSGCIVCTLKVDMKRGTNAQSTISFIGWYVDKKTLVELIMNKDKGKWILKQRVNGVTVAKGNAPGSISTGVTYHVQLKYDGTNFLVSIDGNQILSVPAGAVPNGTVAVRIKGVIGTFDNIEVLP